jgi:hypothetical protein
MPIIKTQASSTAEYLEAIRKIRSTWNPTREEPEELWFRGQERQEFQLQPGLYRPQIRDLGYHEPSIIRVFENLGRSYVRKRPNNAWEWYFLAQHYRLPTRLLDWTESALAALYFAVAAYWQQADKRDLASAIGTTDPPLFDKASPTVWLLDAGSLNQYSVGKDMLFGVPKDELALYLPTKPAHPPATAVPPTRPVAVYPPRQNPRIVAQQGMFTLHGDDDLPIDTLADAHDPAGTIHLAYVQFDRTRLASLVDELILCGVGRLALFPELDSVAEHIRWQYRD